MNLKDKLKAHLVKQAFTVMDAATLLAVPTIAGGIIGAKEDKAIAGTGAGLVGGIGGLVIGHQIGNTLREHIKPLRKRFLYGPRLVGAGIGAGFAGITAAKLVRDKAGLERKLREKTSK